MTPILKSDCTIIDSDKAVEPMVTVDMLLVNALRHLDDEGRKMLVERLSSYGNSAPKVEPLDIDKALKLPTLTDITEYAISCHRNTNHKYDGTKPYGHHLSMVEKVANEFQHLLGMTDTFNVIAACYCHDLIEDTRETYNDVLKRTNKEIADIAYALTNEKGRNRKERANDKYYQGIRDCGKNAVFVKVCDRIANIQYSLENKSGMFHKYVKENNNFMGQLYRDDLKPMFDKLIELTKTPMP